MTHLAQAAHGQRQASTTLAALDLSQDDIVRPELRDDAILTNRRRRAVGSHPAPPRATFGLRGSDENLPEPLHPKVE